MDAASLTRMERLNYLFGGILVIVTAVLTRRDQALGAAVGVALTCLNFAFLRRLVFKWTASVKAGDEQGGRRMFLILPKMIGLMAAVVLSLWLLPIDAIFLRPPARPSSQTPVAPASRPAARPNPARVRIIASSRLRRNRCRSRSPSPRRTIG